MLDMIRRQPIRDAGGSASVEGSHSRCPVCRHGVLRWKYDINGFAIVQCLACSVMFVRGHVSQGELARHYGGAEVDVAMDEDWVYVNQDNACNLNYYYYKLRGIIINRMDTGALLDIGCNAGQFLDIMSEFDRYGVERAQQQARIAKRKYSDNIFEGLFEDYAAGGRLFDCITLQDVLDHMVDPMGTLRKCNELLRPGGMLVVKVHDMSCLYARLMGKRFYALIPPVHLFYFTRESLAIALGESGFKVDGFLHIGHRLFVSTIFYRLSQGRRESAWFKFYRMTKGTWLGRRRVLKNLRDIVTVVATKAGVARRDT